MDEEDRRGIEKRFRLVMELYNLLTENVEGLENNGIPSSKFSKLDYHKKESIVKKKVFIFTDASREKEEGLIGFIAYLKVKNISGEMLWQFLIANSQIVKESMKILRRELYAITLEVKNVGKIKKATGVEEKDIVIYTDSLIAICQIEKTKKEGPNLLG